MAFTKPTANTESKAPRGHSYSKARAEYLSQRVKQEEEYARQREEAFVHEKDKKSRERNRKIVKNQYTKKNGKGQIKLSNQIHNLLTKIKKWCSEASFDRSTASYTTVSEDIDAIQLEYHP